MTVPSASRFDVRRRRLVVVAVLAVLLVLGVVVVASRAVEVPAIAQPPRIGVDAAAMGEGAPAGRLDPGAQDGVIASDAPVSLADTAHPAVARLDPALREALAEAESAASADGVSFEITSGWRSRAYQEWLFTHAVDTYGSVEAAGRYVASPDRSSHVTGDAVDLGPVDAQLWLMSQGARWGLCQIYANERWHFELATTPGGTCPELLADASG